MTKLLKKIFYNFAKSVTSRFSGGTLSTTTRKTAQQEIFCFLRSKGVCFPSKIRKFCGLLAEKITSIFEKSVKFPSRANFGLINDTTLLCNSQ